MEIAFNGRRTEVRSQNLAELLQELAIAPDRIAVERNRALVPRRMWAETHLAQGDAIEVVQMVGGGLGAAGGCA
ncbi:MAG: sulfur carrier protein ThiS [Terriglobales bacterium]